MRGHYEPTISIALPASDPAPFGEEAARMASTAETFVEIAQKVMSLSEGESYSTELAVDDRILARVTDGIYRQPASALRELISNSYDADSTRVVIQTDAPRFERIVIRDNGNGMSPAILAHLITHIGGSSKRTARGKQLGTVSVGDVKCSPGGRRLIGKIGIGLFAVSQLTQHFQIITKRKGDDFRTSAVVVLRTHSEEELSDDEEAKFQTGSVSLTKEPSDDLNHHGTEIILMNLRPATRKGLRSSERWEAIEYVAGEEEGVTGAIGRVEPPEYHVGRIDEVRTDLLQMKPRLPWEDFQAPLEKFEALYKAVSETETKVQTPTLESLFDNYLAALWTLSLSVPVSYLAGHPFRTRGSDGLGVYRLSNKKGEQAEEIILDEKETISERLYLTSDKGDPVGGFQVLLDGVELRHPIVLSDELGHRRNRVDSPLLFVGRCVTPFSKVKPNIGGGELEFEAYFYWNSIIVPKDNRGVLIRVHGASGTLFDETFLDYRVSELTRLKQIMAEVYVTKGLDPAINIDRESFNNAHPHYLYLRDWIHGALRQITNKLKAINKVGREKAKQEKKEAAKNQLEAFVSSVWARQRGAEVSPPDFLLIYPGDDEPEPNDIEDKLIIDLRYETALAPCRLKESDNLKLTSIASILSAHGILDDVSYRRFKLLLADISGVFENHDG
ncbi:MAG TPA: ATP-binding protein [Phycisphaerales bacterium]|nr:ATP-binding protein [Phycisphaerales bacterium]